MYLLFVSMFCIGSAVAQADSEIEVPEIRYT